MALHEKDHKIKNKDEFEDYIVTEHTKTIDDAIAAVHDFEENKQAEYIDMHTVPLNEMYNSLSGKVKELFDNDLNKKIDTEDEQKKVKEAFFAVLKEYMEKVSPASVKGLEETEGKLDDDLDLLMSRFDDIHDVDERDPQGKEYQGKAKSIKLMLGQIKKGKVRDLLGYMKQLQNNDIGAWRTYLKKYQTYHLDKFSTRQLKDDLKSKLEGLKRYDITDSATFERLEKHQYINLIKAAKYDDWERVKLEHYGLEKTNKKEE